VGDGAGPAGAAVGGCEAGSGSLAPPQPPSAAQAPNRLSRIAAPAARVNVVSIAEERLPGTPLAMRPKARQLSELPRA